MSEDGLRSVSRAALYDDWLLAETEATLALARWRTAGPTARAHAHAAYSDALAREGLAADLLAWRVREA